MQFDAGLVGPLCLETAVRLRGRQGLFATVWLAATVAGIGYDLGAEFRPDFMLVYYLAFMFFNMFLMGCITIAILEGSGMALTPRRWHIASIFVISLIFGLAVLLGLIALILPGLYFVGRWFLSVPILFGETLSATDAMRESWRRLERYWMSAALVAVVAFLWQAAPLALAMIVVPADMMARGAVIVAANAVSSAGWVFGIAAAATLYLILDGPKPRAQEIFG